jgi:hypothetical protein
MTSWWDGELRKENFQDGRVGEKHKAYGKMVTGCFTHWNAQSQLVCYID